MTSAIDGVSHQLHAVYRIYINLQDKESPIIEQLISFVLLIVIA
jgi:hypothetical protein